MAPETYPAAIEELPVRVSTGVAISITHFEVGLVGRGHTFAPNSLGTIPSASTHGCAITAMNSYNALFLSGSPDRRLCRPRILRARSKPEAGATETTRGILSHLFPEFGEISGSEVEAALNRRRQGLESG